MGLGKSIKKTVSKAWKGWLGDVVLGAIPGYGWAALGVKHHWFKDAFNSLTGKTAMKKMQESQERMYQSLEDAFKSQPTANASMVASAATTQNVAQQAESDVQNAKKRRLSWSSTVNSSLGSSSGGVGGRATLG